MVPVYALASLLGLISLAEGAGWSLYIDFIRVGWEAYVIFSFLLLLSSYLGGHEVLPHSRYVCQGVCLCVNVVRVRSNLYLVKKNIIGVLLVVLN
jgi:hypothetical protein